MMSFRKLLLAASVTLCVSTASLAAPKLLLGLAEQLPGEKPVTILLLRPSVKVGLTQASGMVEPNAEWTENARGLIQAALEKNLKARQAEMRLLDAPDEGTARLVADYEALYEAVAGSVLVHKFYGAKLPTKKDKFDWTLGPGAQRLAEAAGTNYGLFIYVNDSFASAGRRGVQVAGALGCLVGVCIITPGGAHVYHASLVDLSTGDLVWFNVLSSFKGDVREVEGSDSMVTALLETMPTQPGVKAPKPKAKPKRTTPI
jgi:hypothetical protein